jgi:hypothetical protein
MQTQTKNKPQQAAERDAAGALINTLTYPKTNKKLRASENDSLDNKYQKKGRGGKGGKGGRNGRDGGGGKASTDNGNGNGNGGGGGGGGGERGGKQGNKRAEKKEVRCTADIVAPM